MELKNLNWHWSSGYHYCTASFNKIWTEVLRRFKLCSRCVRGLGWWEPPTMVPPRNKAWHLSSVTHSINFIYKTYLLFASYNLFSISKKIKRWMLISLIKLLTAPVLVEFIVIEVYWLNSLNYLSNAPPLLSNLQNTFAHAEKFENFCY